MYFTKTINGKTAHCYSVYPNEYRRFELNTGNNAPLPTFYYQLPGCELVAAINGGVFKIYADLQEIVKPIGVVVQDGVSYSAGYGDSYDNVLDFVSETGIGGTMWDTVTSECTKYPKHLARSGNVYSFTRNNSTVNVSFSSSDPNAQATYNESAKRTMIGLRADKSVVLICIVDPVTGEEQKSFVNELNLTHAVNLDGGGSSGIYVKGQYQNDFTRVITDAICVYKITGVQMLLDDSAARIRDNVQGNVLSTQKQKSWINVKDFYDWKASDNYRWCWGNTGINGKIEGAFQYDPKVMHPVGVSNSGLLKMKLFGSAARLRTSVQGSVNITVPNGEEIIITEFLPEKASDGYYWCKGLYNGISGYFQYDPDVMFPYGNV